MNDLRKTKLEAPAILAGNDPSDMLGRLDAFPSEFEAALAETPPAIPAPTRLLLGGMGGSAIAGDLAASLLGQPGGGELRVVRGYRLPPSRPGDLLLLCSYSGETEETLALHAEGKALRLPMLAMGSGGTLGVLAGQGMPLMTVPSGSAPRAALPSLLGRLLGLFMSWGGVWDPGVEIPEAIDALRTMAELCHPDRPLAENPAKKFALALGDRRPVFVSLDECYRGVALRLRCQMEENAKCFSLSRELPELHHNSWIPWAEGEFGGIPVWLGEGSAHPRVLDRLRLSAALLQKAGLEGITLRGKGDSVPAQVLTTLLLGDFLSTYHALMRGIDPTPVEPLTNMKRALAAQGGINPSKDGK